METKPITDTPRRIVFWASHPGAPRNPSSSYNKRQPPEDQVKADHCCRDVAIVQLPPELANQMGDSLMMEWLDVIIFKINLNEGFPV